MPTDELKRNIRTALEHAPHTEHVRRVALFGSYLYGTQSTDSDIDLLVEFVEPIGYFGLVEMERHLARELGKPVDLVTPDALSKYFRDAVLRDAEQVYAQ